MYLQQQQMHKRVRTVAVAKLEECLGIVSYISVGIPRVVL